MTFEYVWLKMIEVLSRTPQPMTTSELMTALARLGFALDERALAGGLVRLEQEGLVQILVLNDGGAAVSATAKGERMVRGIVRL